MNLLHLRARWYLVETGTFLSRDPVESEPPYLYVRGNPLNRVDPSGYSSKFPCPWCNQDVIEVDDWPDWVKGTVDWTVCLFIGCHVDYENNVIRTQTQQEYVESLTSGGLYDPSFGAASFATISIKRGITCSTDDILDALMNTQVGKKVVNRVQQYGRPTIIFDPSLQLGRWGGYNGEINQVSLHPVFRDLTPEIGTPVLGHEYVHRIFRYEGNSIIQEAKTHRVEAMIWREIRGGGINTDNATQVHLRLIQSLDEVLETVIRTDQLGDQDILMVYLKDVYPGLSSMKKNNYRYIDPSRLPEGSFEQLFAETWRKKIQEWGP